MTGIEWALSEVDKEIAKYKGLQERAIRREVPRKLWRAYHRIGWKITHLNEMRAILEAAENLDQRNSKRTR